MSVGGWKRWWRFNAVGAIGIVVQLVALLVLNHVFRIHYLAATFIAVELAIIHNFLWHERWTWKDREAGGSIRRLVRFNLANGLVSLVGNVALMPLMVEGFQLGLLTANIAAIAVCSFANFVLADRVVFTTPDASHTGSASILPARALSTAAGGPEISSGSTIGELAGTEGACKRQVG